MEKNLCEINFINKNYIDNFETKELCDGNYFIDTKN